MARTSENGEGEGGSSSCVNRGNGTDMPSIKQEIMVDLDQSSNVSLGEKDWPFVPVPAIGGDATSNELLQGTVIFGSNTSDPVSKEKIEKLLDNSTSMASKKVVSNLLLEIEKLSDLERLYLYFRLPLGRSSDVDPLRIPLNPLGSRPEIMQTVVWIQTHLEEDVEISLPKQEVYEEYLSYCTENSIKPLSTADFGKVMKQVFPNVRPRRLGTRGHSRYCYSGLRKKEELNSPCLTDLDCDSFQSQPMTQQSNGKQRTGNEGDLAYERSCALVREWAEKLLDISFRGMNELAGYLVDKLYVDRRSKTASQWSQLRAGGIHPRCEDDDQECKEGDSDQEHMRELKRKLQEQRNLATQRQPVQNRHNKKSKVSSLASSPQQSSPVLLQHPQSNEKEANKPSTSKAKAYPRNKRKHKSGSQIESTSKELSESISMSSPSLSSKPVGKVAIPRLSRPNSAILFLPTHSQSPSPTINTNKPKFVPIQPKPCGSENGLPAPSLPQLKEEETSRGVPVDMPEGPWGEGTSHDDELAHYWAAQIGEPSTDSLSPKPAAPQNNLSQLRVLLEQNEAKKNSAVAGGLLERRNVRFETPSALTDHNNLGNGNTHANNTANTGGVPPSPNTRRRNFNFTPISPRLTPDVVPPSPGCVSSANNTTTQLRQLLSSSSGIASPFVSPRQTPIPSNLPSSQPHSRHNSGHMMSMDTPTSMVTEASSVSNDSAFVSPLNTPLSVNRSRHNSATNNLLVSRARHSSGASIMVRHAPYTNPSLLASNHGPEGLLSSARSRHSSAGSPSLPRSAPLSPLVQSFPQQQVGESNFGCERLRQDLRRRHVSAGVVLGMNRHQQAGTSAAVRTQTTLNSAVPLWGGNDPLAQEIEGLLDSASSSINDSVLNRSQSVPIHQMFQQFHYQGMQSGPTQSYSSISQPSTPFGCARPFQFNNSAASSPYSYTATPVPTEWNDFSSHANSESGTEGFSNMDPGNLDGLQDIISEVYANNHHELAPCLDGLGAEAMQNSNASHSTTDAFNHMNFHGSNLGMTNMDSDPSLSCSDTGDGYPLSDLSDSVTMPGLLGADDLAATLVALKEAPELNRLVQDVVDNGGSGVPVPQGM